MSRRIATSCLLAGFSVLVLQTQSASSATPASPAVRSTDTSQDSDGLVAQQTGCRSCNRCGGGTCGHSHRGMSAGCHGCGCHSAAMAATACCGGVHGFGAAGMVHGMYGGYGMHGAGGIGGGHFRYPYYSYRAPWYHRGPAVYNVNTNVVW